MFKRLFPILIILLGLPYLSFASFLDVYIAQSSSGSGDGTSCSNARGVGFFNTGSNWGSGASQIGSGTTIHLCGTIASTLTVQDSGSSNSPITILFESGSKLSQPVCPSNTSACLNTNSQSFIVIDGGANGVIESTDNGTGLGNQQGSYGILANGCDGCEIKNLTIQNIYLRTSNTDLAIDGSTARGISFSGSNVLIHDNTLHDAGWGIFNNVKDGDTNVRTYSNDIYNIDHGYILTSKDKASGSGFYFYNNHVHDYANWDSPLCAYHHDGVHAFGIPSNGIAPAIDELWIYNNIFEGPVGACMTGQIFLEGGDPAIPGRTPWTDATGTAYVFNNTFIADDVLNGGIVQLYRGTGHQIYNNTIIGPDGAQGMCLNMNDTTLPKIKNNFISGCNFLVKVNTIFSNPANDLNHNVYANCQSFNCWTWTGHSQTANFDLWKSQTTSDADSVDSISTDGGIDVVTGRPLVASPVLGAGANLTGLGITLLNSDRDGLARPSSGKGPWDVGAWVYGKRPVSQKIKR